MAQAAKRKGAFIPVQSSVSKKQKLSNGGPAPSKAKLLKKQEDNDQSSFDGFTSEEDDIDENGGSDFPVVLDIAANTTNGKEPAHENGNQGMAPCTSFSCFVSNLSLASKSRESHQKQRALTATRKASKPNADEIITAKKLWERLRRKSHVQKDERQKLVAELFDIVTNRVHDFVFKHDSVRVIQCAVKYATIPQKKQIAKELKGSYKTLAESRYAKFLLAKMIVEGDQETKDMIIPEFYGHVRQLINHSEASWILDDVYRTVATKEQKAILLREWYGPEFAVFKAEDTAEITSNLDKIIKKTPEKRVVILKYLQERINQLVQKKMTGFTMLHDAMLQYFLNLAPESEDFSAFNRLILGDNKEEETDLLRNLAFTNSGSELACLAIAYGSAKDRRQMLRAYKDVIDMLAYDKWGYRVLLAAMDVVDDTRELSQRVFNELILLKKEAKPEEQAEKILNLANHQNGHIVVLYPFIGAQRKLLHPDTLRIMQKVQNIRKSTSKKDPDVRRSEIILPLSPPFLHTIEVHASELSSSSFGCQFISEVILDGIGSKEAALKAVANLAQGDPAEPDHISRSPFAGKMLKTLISGGRFDRQTGKVIPVEPKLKFAELLLEIMKSQPDRLQQWILSEGAFVVLQLLEAPWEDNEDGEYVKAQVKSCRNELKNMAAAVSEQDDNDGGNAAEIARKAKAAQLLLEASASW
jgi:pumilio family protein 6